MGFSVGFGSSSSSSKTRPWKEQIPYLTRGFSTAESLLDRGAYPGSYWAGIDPAQTAGYEQLIQGANFAPTLAGQMYGMGYQNLGNYGAAGDYYQSMLAGQQGLDVPWIAEETPELQANIDASLRDMGRQLNWRTLPGIDAAAVGSGNSGSSKRQVQNAIAEGMAADRMADTSAQMRSAYQADAMRARQFNLQQQMMGAQQLQGMGQQGMNWLTGSYDMFQNGSQDMLAAGDYMQGVQQQGVDAALAKHNAPWTQLQNYWNIVGSNNWGGKTSGKSSSMSMGFS